MPRQKLAEASGARGLAEALDDIEVGAAVPLHHQRSLVGDSDVPADQHAIGNGPDLTAAARGAVDVMLIELLERPGFGRP